MASPDNSTLAAAKDFIHSATQQISDSLGSDTVNTIFHYLDHAEYEMAFEILFIELMKLNMAAPIDIAKSRELGVLLRLNEQSVFDSNFWEKFDRYTGKYL
ncbi:MAG: hypothetical protein EOP56_05010 [Sphingobacteriales bacterium]|nr:MAG: hypothetical protein EOP56_05010 [Sphingobacteriales bacterium]